MQTTPSRWFASTSSLLKAALTSTSASASAPSSSSSTSAAAILKSVSERRSTKHVKRDRARQHFAAGSSPAKGSPSSDLTTGLFAREDPAKYLGSVRTKPDGASYFNLGEYNRMLDVHPDMQWASEDGRTSTVHINSAQAPMFPTPSEAELRAIRSSGAGGSASDDALAALAADASNSFTVPQLRALHRYPLVVRRVVNMTSKGKQPSMYTLVVVGDGNGLVGFGEGKSENILKASDRAFVQAVKNLDYVQRKDARTTWADLMSGKWGATVVELRSRPPGFGLRTSPIIHQIAKAAGILDLSAKVRGSRNGMNTVKATINLLHGGAPPLGLGDISGKEKLARRFKGTGMRTATEIGLDLGRKAVELR